VDHDDGCRDARLSGLPSEHWRRIRTNNLLERIMREISAVRGTRRYLNMEPLKAERHAAA
jgi:transposase-like protein